MPFARQALCLARCPSSMGMHLHSLFGDVRQMSGVWLVDVMSTEMLRCVCRCIDAVVESCFGHTNTSALDVLGPGPHAGRQLLLGCMHVGRI